MVQPAGATSAPLAVRGMLGWRGASKLAPRQPAQKWEGEPSVLGFYFDESIKGRGVVGIFYSSCIDVGTASRIASSTESHPAPHGTASRTASGTASGNGIELYRCCSKYSNHGSRIRGAARRLPLADTGVAPHSREVYAAAQGGAAAEKQFERLEKMYVHRSQNLR